MQATSSKAAARSDFGLDRKALGFPMQATSSKAAAAFAKCAWLYPDVAKAEARA